MNKFHINIATGKSGACKATVRSCPYGELGVHFDSQERAEQFSFLSFEPNQDPDGAIVPIETIQKDQARMAHLIQESDFEGLRELITQRSQAEEFQASLAKREELKAQLEELTEINNGIKKLVKSSDEAVAAQARLDERELSNKFRDVYEELAYEKRQLDEYKLISAQAANAASILREEHERATGEFLEYNKDTLGTLKALGEYESGSPEWHAARSSGIGGSDVGAIMRSNKTYASNNLTRMVAGKLGIDDPMILEERPDFRNAAERGNAWEEYVRHTVADKNPDLNIAFCKTSWEGSEESYRHANFDGLLLDKNGVPDGILEIKTGSDPSKWGDPAAGLDGVPDEYKKQVLWYAMNADLKHGMIAAVIDDHDYREYKFDMNDPKIKAEVQAIEEATATFWKDIEKKKAQIEAGVPLTRRKQSRGMKAAMTYESIAEVYAGYADVSVDQAKKQIIASVEAEKKAKGRNLTEQEFQKATVDVFAKHDPSSRQRPLIGVDIETTTASARTGRIIETGIVELGNDTETKVLYSSMHDIPEKTKFGVGLGAYDIHKISPEMIKDKPSFNDPEHQKKILDHLKSGTLVAHNAGFEDRFFSANLPGYIEAKNKGEIKILDTRRLSSFLMPRSENSSLESFSEDNGVPYEGAHAATQDATMMMKALGRLQKSLHTTGHFRKKPINDNLRLAAKKEALKSEDTR